MIDIIDNSNSFGKRTFEIKLGNVLKLELIEADRNTIIVNLIEAKFIKNVIKYSFISNENLLETSKLAIEKAFEYIKTLPDFSWTETQKNNKMHEIVFIIENYNL